MDKKKYDPFQYNFDEEWDVEKVLYGELLKEAQKEQAEQMPSLPREQSRPAAPVSRDGERVPAQRRPAQAPRSGGNRGKKRKTRPNYRGWAILIGMILTAVLLLYLLIRLIVWVVSPGQDQPSDGENITSSSSSSETEPITTIDYNALVAELVETADLQAAMYDYDAAIATVQSIGTDWAQYSDLAAAKQRYEQLKGQTVRWEDTTVIPHIFFHSLIADNARAFDGQNTEDGYNQYMTTIPEFEAMLEEMYARGYVLVRIHDIAKLVEDEDGDMVYRQGDIYLPEGKKPIVMSQDDVNFYEYMIDSDGDHMPDAGGDGFASKLLVGEDGNITCEYITAEGETVYGDYDLVPILETFIKKHPDFSYRGAKAIVALTGYEGVYGYRTDKDGKERLTAEAFQKEIDGAKEVTQWLLDHGWEIASHSYGHPAYGSLSSESVARDVQRWEEEVQPVVGDTDIFIYPYGSDIHGVEKYSNEKYQAMYAAGYRFFCNVDSADYWVQIWDDYVRQGRRNLDGYRLWYDPELLDDLFDAEAVFDPERPTPVPPI